MTGTVIDGAMNAGSTWSRPWPGEPCWCDHRAVARQQRVDRDQQVVVAARAGLEDRESRGGVRDEHAEQPVGLAAHELRALVGEVADGGRAAGADLQGLATHNEILSRGRVVACRWASSVRSRFATTGGTPIEVTGVAAAGPAGAARPRRRPAGRAGRPGRRGVGRSAAGRRGQRAADARLAAAPHARALRPRSGSRRPATGSRSSRPTSTRPASNCSPPRGRARCAPTTRRARRACFATGLACGVARRWPTPATPLRVPAARLDDLRAGGDPRPAHRRHRSSARPTSSCPSSRRWPPTSRSTSASPSSWSRRWPARAGRPTRCAPTSSSANASPTSSVSIRRPSCRRVHLAVLRGELDVPTPGAVRRAPRPTSRHSSPASSGATRRSAGSARHCRRTGWSRSSVRAARARPGWRTRRARRLTMRDGVWLAELAPVTDGVDVAQAVLGALGLREKNLLDRRPNRPVQDAEGRLVDVLGDKAALLVLDNCEHLIDASAQLAAHLLEQCPDLRVLATSREPLGIIGEVVLAVPPLGQPAPDADGRAARSNTPPCACSPTARRPPVPTSPSTTPTSRPSSRSCAGSTACRWPSSSPPPGCARCRSTEIAARLSDRFRLLTGGSRTAMPRHRTLRAVVEWSWELLTEPERVLVERLAIFPAGVIERERGARCAPTTSLPADRRRRPARLARSTSRCCSASATGAALRMLETIREYGMERLAERGELSGLRAGTPTTSPRCSTRPNRMLTSARPVAVVRPAHRRARQHPRRAAVPLRHRRCRRRAAASRSASAGSRCCSATTATSARGSPRRSPCPARPTRISAGSPSRSTR